MNEVFVPLQDTIVEKDSYYLDPDNDIIVTYSARQRLYIARVGLDGTLKDNVMLPESDVNYFQYRHVGLYNRFSREYCLWGVTSNDYAIKNVVVDSTLNFVRETKFGSCYDGESNEQIMYFNDSTYILSSFYGNTHYPYENGVHLSKFNKDNECIDMAIFIEGDFFMAFLLVLNDDGTSTPEMEDIVRPFIVYPNPAFNALHIDISPDVADQVNEISLYDISGRLVKAQQSGFGSIDISGLAPGMYVMKVALGDGKVFEEKIVKE
ncbi:MAG: T9SS type A sorting domain-containing protein [Bacteroidales bacterium]|nr:T9SS type A sorting domain-containing protein [Bacteroidales bacterium]